MKKFTIFAALVLAAGMLGQVFADSAGNKDRLARKLQTLNSIAKELETSYVDTIAVDEIMDNTIQALLYYTDPYTEYYPSNEQDELLQLSAGGYAGIGSVIGKRVKKFSDVVLGLLYFLLSHFPLIPPLKN